MTNRIEVILSNMRLTGVDRHYYRHQLEEFTTHFNPKKIKYIAFGKQDIRGTESITLFDSKGCVPTQKHFKNKAEMLGYIVGYNSANANRDFS